MKIRIYWIRSHKKCVNSWQINFKIKLLQQVNNYQIFHPNQRIKKNAMNSLRGCSHPKN